MNCIELKIEPCSFCRGLTGLDNHKCLIDEFEYSFNQAKKDNRVLEFIKSLLCKMKMTSQWAKYVIHFRIAIVQYVPEHLEMFDKLTLLY